MRHLREVLKMLDVDKFYAKLSKCEFATGQIAYLGHIVSKDRVCVDPGKVEAINKWPVPSNIKNLRGFRGLTGYYCKYVFGYAQLARPLTQLLRKDAFIWTDEALTAFNALKQALSTTPTLALPNFHEQFEVRTDASGHGVGAVLSQKGQPIAYFSKQLSPTLQASSTYNRELCTVVLAVQKWRQYLLGNKFVLVTDHQPLRTILTQTVHTPD